MGATLTLIENDYIAHTVIADPWAIDQVMGMFAKGNAFRDEAIHKIHALIDVSAAKTVPPGVLQARRLPGFSHHPNSGDMVVVGATSYWRALFQTLGSLSHTPITFFDSEAEAMAYLRHLIAVSPTPNPPASTE